MGPTVQLMSQPGEDTLHCACRPGIVITLQVPQHLGPCFHA